MNKLIISSIFLLMLPINSKVGDIKIKMVVPPKERMTSRWAFEVVLFGESLGKAQVNC